MNAEYTAMSYRDIADRYNQINFITDEAALAVGQAVAGIVGQGKRIVDLGGGAGRITVPLAAAGLDAIDMDLEYNMLQASRVRAQDFGTELRQVNGDITRLPFASAHFDAAITTSVLHLVTDWQAALAEAARILKPGAPLLIGRNILDEDSCAGQIRKKLRMIAGTHDPSIRPTAAAGPALFEHLQSMGGELRKPVNATDWLEALSPRDIMQRIESRTHNETWALSDDTHAVVVEQIGPWIEQHFDDPAALEDVRSEFVLYPVYGLA